MNTLVKQLLITTFLTILLTIIHYFNNKNVLNKNTKSNYYIKLTLFNFIIINVSFFCGYKLFGDNEISDEVKGDNLVVDNGEPDF